MPTYLIHLERSGDGLNQDGTTDGATGHANVVLGEVEDIIPETSLKMRLHLGEIEVRAVATGNELLGIVVEVETEVKETTGDGLAINLEVLLIEVPAASTGNQSREGAVGAELVLLVALLEVDLATDGIVQVDLAVDHVLPGGSRGVCITNQLYAPNPNKIRQHTLEIGHVGPDIRVQSIDNHLPIGRAGDLNAAVDQTGSGGGALPGIVVTDVLGLGQEVGEMALVDFGLAVYTALEEGLAGGIEGAVQDSEESASILGKDPAAIVVQGTKDGDILELSLDVSHVDTFFRFPIKSITSVGYTRI